jgi:glycosyltransferase involved in cell wall biosynthesis
MRIAFDYTAGIRQRAGIGNYIRRLVGALLQQDKSNQYTLLTSGRATREHSFPLAPNARGRSVYIPDRYLNILWYRWRLPLYATYFTGHADIYHGPDFALPPLGKGPKKVVTIHDLAFLDYPEYAVPSLSAYLKKIVLEAVASADVICTVSEEVSRTLIQHFSTPREKLTVIPNGVNPYLRRITDPVLLEATRHKFGLKSPLVFTASTLEPRKNHSGLIKAFYQAQKQKHGPAMLAIAGGKGWLYEETEKLVRDLHLEDNVRFLGRVSDYDLVTLYSLADVFAFPSFAEGFGLPPLEAMACGLPVITSNTTSLPEVVGNAALLVNPHNPEELANAMIRILHDTNLQEDLRQKGYERVKQFTWDAAARKMLSVYQRLYEGVTDFSDVEKANAS